MLSKDFADTDERLSQHISHKESQNKPGMMVSGIVNMRDGPLGSLVPPGCKIGTDAWLDAMAQHVIPECEAIGILFASFTTPPLMPVPGPRRGMKKTCHSHERTSSFSLALRQT